MTINQKDLISYLKSEGYSVTKTCEIGLTSFVFEVSRNGRRFAVKSTNADRKDDRILHNEYELLIQLSKTAIRPYIPQVYSWLPEIESYVMELLEYPNSLSDSSYVKGLANVLTTIHTFDFSQLVKWGFSSQNPEENLHEIICKPLKTLDRLFGIRAMLDDSIAEHVSTLYDKRSHYQPMVKQAKLLSKCLKPSLIHGDLSGDNLMIRNDGTPVLVDWTNTRIGFSILDIANLLICSEWEQHNIDLFFTYYKSGWTENEEKSLPLKLFCDIFLYRACVNSVELITKSDLDEIGLAFYKRQYTKLKQKFGLNLNVQH